MDRWACVDVFALPLQILLRERLEWREVPAAVIEDDRPQAKLLYLNRRAREGHLRAGMRYGEALALLPDLRAGVISSEAIGAAVDELARRLVLYSPRVEPSPEEAGVFWLNLSGMGALYPELSGWVEELRAGLEELDYFAAVVVGFTRFGTYAVARAHRRTGIFDSPMGEKSSAQGVPLSKLISEARIEEDFGRLGLETVADLLALPAEGLRRRYGPELHRLWRMARGDLDEPGRAFEVEEPAARNALFEGVEEDANRLLFYLKGLVHKLVCVLEERHEALAALEISLILDDGGRLEEVIRPAEPTMDELVLIDLLRLWLERIDLGAGVVEVDILARGMRTVTEQLKLFVDPGQRDLSRANRALARLRAELGSEAVGYLELREAHLPEARFHLATLERLDEARPRHVQTPPLVRRFYPRALSLPPSWDHRERTIHHGGPHVISGGWWGREVHRTYFFVEAPKGEIQWVYYDAWRERWFLHGEL